jgi:peptidoglycan/LPS O-acetylase OafA/YrhL
VGVDGSDGRVDALSLHTALRQLCVARSGRYRPDIDGLRAIAVLAVVGYHIGVVLPGGAIGRLSGGFVGVDIFFIISGYLITGIIYAGLLQTRFSLLTFYERRARRILPALFVMLAVTSMVAGQDLFPTELADHAKALLSAVFSLSNLYFWSASGYFTATADTKLLLHTWSLAVEEQFYLGWPLLLLLLFTRLATRTARITVTALAALSFAVSVVGVHRWPEATFYLPFGRGWELILGAALPLGIVPAPKGRLAREACGGAGLALIALAFVAIRPETPFPGAAALLPCLGALLVVAGGENGSSLVGGLLSLRPLVFIGTISYSLYLWHWPILLLQKVMSLVPGSDVGKAVKVEVFLLSILVASLSWWLVERPFRRGYRGATVFALSGAGAAALALVGCVELSGLPGRFPPEAIRLAQFLDYPLQTPGIDRCQLSSNAAVTPSFVQDCVPDHPARPALLILGDSHANHLRAGLLDTLSNTDVLELTASGCKPHRPGEPALDACGAIFQYYYQHVAPRSRIHLVVLAGRWAYRDLDEVAAFLDEARARAMPVLLIGPIVQYDQALPRLLAQAERFGDPGRVAKHQLDVSALDRDMARLAADKGVRYVSLLTRLCPNGRCVTMLPDGVPLQFDYGHLTADGSRLVATSLLQSGDLDIVHTTPMAAAP